MTSGTLRALLAAAALATAAFPASAQEPPPPAGLTEEQGVLSHAPTGIALPESLAGLKRVAHFPGDPAVVIYAPPTLRENDPRRLAFGIGPARTPPPVERIRRESRSQAGGGADLKIVSEGAFPWPGQPGALTFRGAYLAGGMSKQYWHAWANGHAIIVMAEWPADEPEQVEKIAAALTRLFGAPLR